MVSERLSLAFTNWGTTLFSKYIVSQSNSPHPPKTSNAPPRSLGRFSNSRKPRAWVRFGAGKLWHKNTTQAMVIFFFCEGEISSMTRDFTGNSRVFMDILQPSKHRIVIVVEWAVRLRCPRHVWFFALGRLDQLWSILVIQSGDKISRWMVIDSRWYPLVI